MFVQKQAHKHSMKVRHEVEVLAKIGKKRWIIIDYCTGCEYKLARDTTYDRPAKELQ